MKRTLLTIGTIAAVAAPVASVVACGTSHIQPKNEEAFRGTLKEDLKILTLGDSVAHGDYTFQMSGSGTGFMPLLDGPARAASYQDYLFDEFQRDGLMSKEDKPDYKTSASGLRSGELAQWLIKNSYLEGMKVDNPGFTVDGSEDKEHVDYHRHPYTNGNGAGAKTWWDDGLKDENGKPSTAFHSDVKDGQQDPISMERHIEESNVVLITIGGNDILKDIMVMGTPFPNLSSIDKKTLLPNIVGQLLADKTLKTLPGIQKVISQIAQIAQPAFKTSIESEIEGIKTKLLAMLTDKDKPISLPGDLTKTFGSFLTSIAAVPESERITFEKWFLVEGHKMLITVDQTKLKESLEQFSKNIKLTSDKIHEINPGAKVIYTGYPSPMMHFPKVFRNLAIPIYGQIAKRTEDFAKSDEGTYFAPSSLQNWETDDPADIYDNILVDPHPTLEGQGAMASDILKVIDQIYGLKAKLTDEELKAKTTSVIEEHKLEGPVMSGKDKIAAIKDGTYKYPYQTAATIKNRGDLDYAYGVKPLPIEELTHAKVYFTSRIFGFLIDSITDSIQLNDKVDDPKDQSVPHSGVLTMSDFTKRWGDNYIDYSKVKGNEDERFIKPLGKEFVSNVEQEFLDSVVKFAETFKTKLAGVLSTDEIEARMNSLLSFIK